MRKTCVVINNEEMAALNEVWMDTYSEYDTFHEKSCKQRKIQNPDFNNEKDMESIIKNFLLLNDIKKYQVSYILETLNIGNENEKLIILESLGLNHLIKNL